MKLRPSIILISLSLAPAVSMADLSGNIGVASVYVYRGIFQEDSSASAGIDYESDNGFYLGTWGADVGAGIEADVYGGYGAEVGDFNWGVGFTGYYYPDDFDDTYQEVNLGFGYGGFSFDAAIGEWGGFGTSEDYTFYSLTYAFESGPYFTFGKFGDQFSGDYLELGYSTDFMGVDLSIALINTNDLAVSERDPSAEYTLTFGLSYGFGIGQ